MFIHSQNYKDRLVGLRHASWLSRHLILSVLPYQNCAGKVFAPGGYQLIYSSSLPPSYRYPHLPTLDWLPWPSYNSSKTFAFFNPLVATANLRWQAERSLLGTSMTFLATLRPWSQNTQEFNPNIDPVYHLRIRTPHVSINCQNGLSNPVFIQAGTTTVPFAAVKSTFYWVAISIDQNVMKILWVDERGRVFSQSAQLAQPISPAQDSYIEIHYEPVISTSLPDPKHNDHLVGQMHLFDRALPLDILRDMLLNQHTMRGWIHPGARGEMFFPRPFTHGSLRARADVFSQISEGPVHSSLAVEAASHVRIPARAFIYARGDSLAIPYGDSAANVRAQVRANIIHDLAFATIDVIALGEAISFTAFLSGFARIGEGPLRLGPLHGFVNSIGQIRARDIARGIILLPVPYEASFETTIINSIHLRGFPRKEAFLNGRNPLHGILFGNIHAEPTHPARVYSLGNLWLAPRVLLQSHAQLKVPSRAWLTTSPSVFSRLLARSEVGLRLVSVAGAFGRNNVYVLSKGRHNAYTTAEARFLRSIITVLDRIRTSNRVIVLTFCQGEIYIEDELPAFGRKTARHILDL